MGLHLKFDEHTFESKIILVTDCRLRNNICRSDDGVIRAFNL